MYLYVERIRDFFGYALYKFTFYLLTYLLNLTEKCLWMRPHFPFAEPWTASETDRLFPCYPQWWPRCVSRSPAPVLWPADSMSLLSLRRPERRFRSRSSQVPDTLRSCCLPPAWLPLPAEFPWSSNETHHVLNLLFFFLLLLLTIIQRHITANYTVFRSDSLRFYICVFAARCFTNQLLIA